MVLAVAELEKGPTLADNKRHPKPIVRVAVVHATPIIRRGLARIVARGFDSDTTRAVEVTEVKSANAASSAILLRRPHLAIYQQDFPGMSIESMLATVDRHDLNVRLVAFDLDWTGNRLGVLLSAGVMGALCVHDDEATIVKTVEVCLASRQPNRRWMRATRSKRQTGRPFAAGNVPNITAREIEVLQCIADGRSIEATARHLGVSKSTVKNLRHSLYSKLNVPNGGAAVASGKSLQLIR